MKELIIKTIKNPTKAVKEIAWLGLHLYTKIQNSFMDLKKPEKIILTDFKELNEIKNRAASKRTNINEHLETLFLESLVVKPKLIVELGVRTGKSNFAFSRVAKLCNANLVGVDIDDCSEVYSYKKGYFIQKDDIQFAKEFKQWCKKHKIKPEIDILFIDTSHLYDHTLQEIKYWFPYLSKKAKVFFHDSNVGWTYKRKDGSIGRGRNDMYHGVIRAIETYLGTTYNRKKDFVDYRKGWLIKHYAHCCGLTIFEKIPLSRRI